jgi:diazepam-binding inhibitor (GABA receptor modulator, acyl-CoA-binding protein)
MRSVVAASMGLSPPGIGSSRAKMLATMGARQWRFSPNAAGPPRGGRRPTFPEEQMADLKSRFEQAVAESKTLPEKPDNMTLLKIYALYKQASAGDVEGKRPGFTDMVGRAKWDAWNEVKGKSAEEAMQEYVDLIESLK